MKGVNPPFSLEASLPSPLLLGETGQLGMGFHSLISEKALLLLKRSDIDFLQPERLVSLVTQLRPKVIINAVAYTSVDQAEVEPERAYRINAQSVAALSEAARQVGALLVHFSSDYVFDGYGKMPWREEDKSAPLNVYGLSKLQGEQAIMASGCRYLIFRTSWLHSPYRRNFLKSMLHLGQERKSLSVVCDQIGAPTSAVMLGAVTLRAIEQTLVNPGLYGLYHVTATGETSWYDYARFIFDEAKALGYEFTLNELKPVQSHNYPAVASRPLNSRLDTTKFCSTFDIALPDWRDGVRETLWRLTKGIS